jgi:hypothetical protein
MAVFSGGFIFGSWWGLVLRRDEAEAERLDRDE